METFITYILNIKYRIKIFGKKICSWSTIKQSYQKLPNKYQDVYQKSYTT